MEQAQPPQLLKFGPYLVDLAAGEVRKNGTRIRLQEKPLRVLALLAEKQGQLVSREELRRRLWPEDTFVDFETGLNTAVSKLRDTLSDNAENPRYIETIPRRGYRFVAAVEFTGMLTPKNGAAATASEAQPSDNGSNGESAAAATQIPAAHLADAHKEIEKIRSASALWIRATVGAAMALLAATVWWLTPLQDPRVTEIFPVTTTGRMDYLVRPATDGGRIFYVQRAGDHYELMQASTSGGEAQKMQGPFPNTLIWDVTQDGSKYLITSFARRGEPAPLWIWPATGGIPLKIGDIVSGSASFSPDGQRIAYHVGHDLMIANTDGGGIRKLASFSGDEPDSPVWSPDGKKIRFNRNDPLKDTNSIWEVDVDGGNMHPVLPGWQETPKQCCGTWTPDGRYFLFVEGSGPDSRLYAIREKGEWWRRSPRGPFLLASEATGSWSPLVSRDGKNVYYYGPHIQSDLQLLDVKTQQFTGILQEKHPAMLSVSSDGQWISYLGGLKGMIWTSHFDGSDARQIQLPEMRAAFPRFSPDNRKIAFTALRFGSPQSVQIVDAAGGTPQSIVPDSAAMSDPDWSPDGANLVVDQELQVAPGKPAQSQLVFVELKTARTEILPGSEDLHMPRWSPDGKYIAAISGSRSDLMLFDVAAKKWARLAQGKSLGFPVWSPDGANLYYQDIFAPGQPLFEIHLANGAQTKVASFEKILATGIARCVLVGLAPGGAPMIAFDRSTSDIYGARLALP